MMPDGKLWPVRAFAITKTIPKMGRNTESLYNWYAASSDKIAPKGWRVPTHEEQIALQQYLIANGYNFDGTVKEGTRLPNR
jgi:uncharacterized protein (TIGR02145 family)